MSKDKRLAKIVKMVKNLISQPKPNGLQLVSLYNNWCLQDDSAVITDLQLQRVVLSSGLVIWDGRLWAAAASPKPPAKGSGGRRYVQRGVKSFENVDATKELNAT